MGQAGIKGLGFAATVVLVVVACGGSSGSEESGAQAVPLEDYWEGAAGALCERAVPCCEDLEMSVTHDECVQLFAQYFNAELAFADPAKFDYDAKRGGECIQATRRANGQAGCDFDAPVEDESAEACERIFVGKVEPGDRCNSSFECAATAGQNAFCEPEGDGSGRCVAGYRAGAGDDCVWSCVEGSDGTITCYPYGNVRESSVRGECYASDGLYCADGTCRATVAIGGACSSSEACEQGGFCAGDECARRGDAGAVCGSDTECQEGLFCQSEECVPLADDGEPCVYSYECDSDWCKDGECQPNTTSAAILCGAIVGER